MKYLGAYFYVIIENGKRRLAATFDATPDLPPTSDATWYFPYPGKDIEFKEGDLLDGEWELDIPGTVTYCQIRPSIDFLQRNGIVLMPADHKVPYCWAGWAPFGSPETYWEEVEKFSPIVSALGRAVSVIRKRLFAEDDVVAEIRLAFDRLRAAGCDDEKRRIYEVEIAQPITVLLSKGGDADLRQLINDAMPPGLPKEPKLNEGEIWKTRNGEHAVGRQIWQNRLLYSIVFCLTSQAQAAAA